MSKYHCSCGLAVDNPAEFGDHQRESFTPADDTDADGRIHVELTDDAARIVLGIRAGHRVPAHVCACGLATDDTAEIDDHYLTMFTPPDGTGLDGIRHVSADPSTSQRWFLRAG